MADTTGTYNDLRISNVRNISEYESLARELLNPTVFEDRFGYVGDANWSTLTNNVTAFSGIRIRPRVLRGNSDRDLATSVLGTPITLPVLAAPVGTVDEFSEDGESPVATAAQSAGTIAINPCLGKVPIKVLARGRTVWQQVWIFRERQYTEFLVRQAEEAGARAIVLTVSNVGAPWWRTDNLNSGDLPEARFITSEPCQALADFTSSEPVPSRGQLYSSIDTGIGWADVDWLKNLTSLPIVIKGVQTAEDCRIAVEHGVDAVVVSNHGGRFLQGSIGTLDALPEVVDASRDYMEVYLDGGVRSGVDVLKALSLGARAVFVGRPVLWALISEGVNGVRAMLEILRYELDAAMGLSGISSTTDADRSLVQTVR